MTNTLVIYHGNCADGFTAAWSIWRRHPDWEFYTGKHSANPPDVTGKDVYMVDFSYKRPAMLELAKAANSITILDHHKSAQEDLVDLPDNVHVVFDMDRSGAMITWEYFHGPDFTPTLVKYVQDRDLWKFEYAYSKEIAAHIFSYEYTFENWQELYRDLDTPARFELAVNSGLAILKKQDKDVDELLQNKYDIVIGGSYTVPTVNLPYTLASDGANKLSEGKPFASSWYFDGEGFVFSLRSKENGIDVCEIAKLYNGGGHKHAAGFKVKSMDDLRNALLPIVCPFCKTVPFVTGSNEHRVVAVSCESDICKIQPSTAWYLDRAEAIEVWNRRIK
jgi:hypothetical protein